MMTCPDRAQYLPPDPAGGPPLFDELCGLSIEQWADAFADLLPRGTAWNRDPRGVLMGLLRALAGVPLRDIAERICQIRQEVDPRTVEETLERWERWLDLTNQCGLASALTIEQRRAMVIAAEVGGGILTEYGLTAQAAIAGFSVVVQEEMPIEVGCAEVGQRMSCYGGLTVYVCCAEPWASLDALRCYLDRIIPIHIIFGVVEGCPDCLPPMRWREP